MPLARSLPLLRWCWVAAFSLFSYYCCCCEAFVPACVSITTRRFPVSRDQTFSTLSPPAYSLRLAALREDASSAGKKFSRTNHNRGRHERPRSRSPSSQRPRDPARKEWLQNASVRLLQAEAGSLTRGKWHELVSLFTGWKTLCKFDREAPLQMETLLKRLLDEQSAQEGQIPMVDIRLYNSLLDAWACAALFRTHGVAASQRAREVLVTLQETYERQSVDKENGVNSATSLQPNEKSFDMTLHAVTRTEGPLVARRLLAWKEHLYKSGKNTNAQPTRKDYVLVLDAYANTRDDNAGLLAEGLVKHMKATGVQIPDTHCYNICIKAWTRSKRGRESAEHADRILEEMETEPDLITYASVINAWAQSGMKGHAVSRAEELLREVEDHPVLEPNTVVLNSVLSTWVKARTPASVDRTAEILQHMEECEQADLISYNTHLHAVALHGGGKGNARRAEEILEFLEAQADGDMQPNVFSYNCALEAWSKSGEKDAAVRAAIILQRLLKRRDMKPDTYSFNQVLLAISRSSLPHSAESAKKWLDFMDTSYSKGIYPRASPDLVSYLAVVSSYARSGISGAASRAEEVFRTLHEKYRRGRKDLKPNRYIYNAMIDCWAKSKKGTLGARKAEALLQEMERQHKAGDLSMQPDASSYNGVLNAWARSNTRCCALKAETYLERMWQLHQNGNRKVKPDDRSYNTVINAISKSKDARKAQRALRVLRMMDMLYRSGKIEISPSVITYTAVLNSCAFPVARDSRSRRKALDTALFTLAEVQSSEYCRPNEATYGTFIRACANLLHDDDNLRREIIEKAFKQCCEDGQVGDQVLGFLRKAAPADLYEELLADFVSSGNLISAEDLPAKWRCNVNGKRSSRSSNRKWTEPNKRVNQVQARKV